MDFCKFSNVCFLVFNLQLQLWLENPKIQLTCENALPQIEAPYNSEYAFCILVCIKSRHENFPRFPRISVFFPILEFCPHLNYIYIYFFNFFLNLFIIIIIILFLK